MIFRELSPEPRLDMETNMTEKRICEICGTIYDAALDRCPLCETPYQAYSGEAEEYEDYDYEYGQAPKSRARRREGEPGWKVAAAVVLAFVLVVFGAFIAYEFLIGSPASDGSVACTGLYLADDEIALTTEGESYFLAVRATPDDVTDDITYDCANGNVVSVDEYGKVTALTEGQTQITVTCGDYSASCTVTCAFEI